MKGRKSARRSRRPERDEVIAPEVLAAEAWSIDVGPGVWEEGWDHDGTAQARLAGPSGTLLLRRYRRGVAPAWLEAIHAGVAYLVRRGFTQFPTFLETERGETLIHHGGDWYDLSEWSVGQRISAEDLSEEQRENLGATVACLHLAGLGAPGPAVRFDWVSGHTLQTLRFAWDPVARGKDAWQSPEILAAFFHASELHDGVIAADETAGTLIALAGQALDWLGRTGPLNALTNEPPTLTHGSLGPNQVRWDGAEVSALINHNTLALRPPLGDLAALCADFGRWDPERCRAILTGYRRYREVPPESLGALPRLGVLRILNLFREYLRVELDPTRPVSPHPRRSVPVETWIAPLRILID